LKIGVLVYVKKDDKYLMIKRNKKNNDFHEGYWVAPGGKREKNETIRTAAERELKEETGLSSNTLKFLGFLNFPDLGNSPFNDEWLGFVFLCKNYHGTLIEESPEGLLKWIKKEKMMKLKMWEGDYFFTGLILEEKKFDIQLTYDGNRLVDKKIKLID
jgi:8-oxo-dGTP diphosphatase